MKNRQAGFTLIELMVVITIIALLMVTLMPQILGANEAANQTADQANMKFHYQNFQEYQRRYNSLPTGGGHKFLLDTWVRGIAEHTAQVRDRFFSPQVQGDDYYKELTLREPTEIWKSQDELTSLDTHYAAISSEHKRGFRWGSGKQILLATDNEGFNFYSDGSVVVMYGDGVPKVLRRDPDFAAVGYEKNVDAEDVIIVGPDSLHEGLQKLEP